MAAKKPIPEDQIAHLQTALDGYKQQLAETTSDLEAVRKRANEEYDKARGWKKRADELETEVGQLRDDLHAITVEKARLEGYIDRAREFDQPAPQEPEAMVTVPESMIRPPRNQRRELFPDELTDYGSNKNRPAPWYKRDI